MSTVPQNLSPEKAKVSELGEAASVEEIRAAIQSLTAGELLKLERYAFFRVRSLGRQNLGRESGDLLRDAITLTLSGDRRWNRHKIDFFTHLVGVMRSVSSHWKEKEAQLMILSEKDAPAEQAPGSLLEGAASESPEPDRQLDALKAVQRIKSHFEADEDVRRVIEGFEEGMKGPEVQKEFGMTRQRFESAVRRLRRRFAGEMEGTA